MVEVRKGWWKDEVSRVPTAPASASFDLSGSAFHGPVFNNAVFNDAVTLTQTIGTAPAKQAELTAALEAFRKLLAGLPATGRETANEAAETAGKLVEAVKPIKDEAFFRRQAAALRAVAGDIAASLPSVTAAAEAVIRAVGQIRGWM